jgi:hypothetical protein
VGDVRLRYESPLLIGELRPRRPSPVPDVLLAAAAVLGLVTVALLLFRTSSPGIPWVELLLGVAAAALMGVAARTRARHRHRRRFVLNFADETLRLESFASAGALRATVRVHPFDAVEELEVEPREQGGFRLVVRMGTPPGRAVLVDEVLGEEIAQLRQLWAMLRAAFGIRTPSAHGGASPGLE